MGLEGLKQEQAGGHDNDGQDRDLTPSYRRSVAIGAFSLPDAQEPFTVTTMDFHGAALVFSF
jgi:hypothetical protein